MQITVNKDGQKQAVTDGIDFVVSELQKRFEKRAAMFFLKDEIIIKTFDDQISEETLMDHVYQQAALLDPAKILKLIIFSDKGGETLQ